MLEIKTWFSFSYGKYSLVESAWVSNYCSEPRARILVWKSTKKPKENQIRYCRVFRQRLNDGYCKCFQITGITRPYGRKIFVDKVSLWISDSLGFGFVTLSGTLSLYRILVLCMKHQRESGTRTFWIRAKSGNVHFGVNVVLTKGETIVRGRKSLEAKKRTEKTQIRMCSQAIRLPCSFVSLSPLYVTNIIL